MVSCFWEARTLRLALGERQSAIVTIRIWPNRFALTGELLEAKRGRTAIVTVSGFRRQRAGQPRPKQRAIALEAEKPADVGIAEPKALRDLGGIDEFTLPQPAHP